MKTKERAAREYRIAMGLPEDDCGVSGSMMKYEAGEYVEDAFESGVEWAKSELCKLELKAIEHGGFLTYDNILFLGETEVSDE